MSAPASLVVAVLTFRRPGDIAELVPLLLAQARAVTPTGVVSTVLVVDNDPVGSARAALVPFAASDLRYVVESRPGISAARNRALAESVDQDLLAFIDDDERPGPDWLQRLVDTRAEYSAAAVAGRVVSQLTGELDPWIAAGGFFERRHRDGVPTGAQIPAAATNNLLLDLRTVRALSLRFDDDFGLSGGEDSLFTQTLTASGHRMVWCAEAVVTDRVPAERVTRDWVVRRAVSSGNSEARVALRLAGAGTPGVRLRLLSAGLARVVGGLVSSAVGAVGRDLARRARGVRTAARGAGLVGGALGWTYLEYRRTAGPPAPTAAVLDAAP